MNTKEFDPITALAYHEAGHAVIAYRHGFEVQEATIVPNDQLGTLGYLHRESTFPEIDVALLGMSGTQTSWDYRRKLEKQMIGLLAGLEAELLYSGARNEDGAESDINQVLEIAAFLTDGDIEETDGLIAHFLYTTHQQVRENRHFIEYLADLLIERNTMTPQEIIEAFSILEAAEHQVYSSGLQQNTYEYAVTQGEQSFVPDKIQTMRSECTPV